jgi:exonuclease III
MGKKEIQEGKEKGMETIICGDFNGVVNPSIDRSNEKNQNTNTENGLLEWLVENHFTDSSRELYPEVRAYSFHDISRLDMIWLAGSLKESLTEAGMMPLESGIQSDHKGVFEELDVRILVTLW